MMVATTENETKGGTLLTQSQWSGNMIEEQVRDVLKAYDKKRARWSQVHRQWKFPRLHHDRTSCKCVEFRGIRRLKLA